MSGSRGQTLRSLIMIRSTTKAVAEMLSLLIQIIRTVQLSSSFSKIYYGTTLSQLATALPGYGVAMEGGSESNGLLYPDSMRVCCPASTRVSVCGFISLCNAYYLLCCCRTF